MGSYVPNTRDEQREMLREIGFADFEEMFSQIPKEVRFAHSLHLPEGMSEQGVIRRMEELAGKNKVFRLLSLHIAAASAAAVAPSYTEALAASMPVSSQIMV